MNKRIIHLFIVLVLLVSLFYTVTPVPVVYAELFQLDISSIFNADVVINDSDPTNTGLDGAGTAYYTQSAYEAACPADTDNPSALVDDGYYPANAYHPNIQLGFSEDDNGDNVYVAQGVSGDTGFIDIPDASYASIHIIAVSTEGNTPVTLTYRYSDNSEVTTASQNILDWAANITETTSLYYIDIDMDRSHDNATGCEDIDNINIFGVKYDSDPSKIMTSFRVNYDASGDSRRRFVLFGATGENDTPDSVSENATNIQQNSLQLNGTVNARGTATVSFDFGFDTGYGIIITADQSPLTSSTDTSVSADAIGLAPGTTYHYRVVATNGVGTSYGDDITVNTLFLAPTVAGTSPSNNASISSQLAQIQVSFDQSVTTASAEDLSNYILVEDGQDGTFQTMSCGPVPGSGGVKTDDIEITINSASYDNSNPYVATLTFDPLQNGRYRLFVCGTTSIENADGTELNGGVADTTLDFTIRSAIQANSLPLTGFPKGKISAIPDQPVNKAYDNSGLILEIPRLDVSMPIVSVPLVEGEWDVTWLGNNAGYLSGSAFPTWNGNTVITGHVWDAYNNPGPFSEIKKLKYGDIINIHAWGLVYSYEVRQSNLYWPTNSISKVFQEEDNDWLTLFTCETYNPLNEEYLFRRTIRAILIDVN